MCFSFSTSLPPAKRSNEYQFNKQTWYLFVCLFVVIVVVGGDWGCGVGGGGGVVIIIVVVFIIPSTTVFTTFSLSLFLRYHYHHRYHHHHFLNFKEMKFFYCLIRKRRLSLSHTCKGLSTFHTILLFCIKKVFLIWKFCHRVNIYFIDSYHHHHHHRVITIIYLFVFLLSLTQPPPAPPSLSLSLRRVVN